MKRIVLLFVAVMAVLACVPSCGTSSTNDQNADSTKTEAPKSALANVVIPSDYTTYENAENGFSIAYPPVCKPQNNDAQLEKSFRGKLFIGDGAMLTAQCSVKDDGTPYPQDYFDMGYKWAKEVQKENLELRLDEKSDTEFVLKMVYKEDQMVHNMRQIFKDGKVYNVDYSYPVEKASIHDPHVDAVLASLKVK